MVELTIDGPLAIFEVRGMDRLWALKSRLEVPLARIRAVRVDPARARGWFHGIRAPGTSVPGVLVAGTFYQDGRRVFFDVHDPDRTIVVEIADDYYDELVVEVADPAATVARLRLQLEHGAAE